MQHARTDHKLRVNKLTELTKKHGIILFMQQRVVNGAFIVHDGKFLIAKRSDNDTFLPGIWEIPGGKLEFGEEPSVGALREIKEETGLDVELVTPLSVWSYGDNHEGTQYIQIDYLCKIIDETNVKLSEEHSDFAWITFEELNNYEISPEMKKEILKFATHPLIKTL